MNVLLLGLVSLVAVLSSSTQSAGEANEPPRPTGVGGVLELVVKDRGSNSPTPVRVRILDDHDVAHLPPGAVEYPAQCNGQAEPDWRLTTEAEGPPATFVPAPFGGGSQFYSSGPMRIPLPEGRYRIRAEKGPEYTVAQATVEVGEGETTPADLFVERWAHMTENGWYSADDHLHIPRPAGRGRAVDERLIGLMEAEDLNVANLLQMGTFKGVVASRQGSFGDASVHREGDTLIASAQENPRTWLLGHGIILGADSYIDFPDSYMVYDQYWKEAAERDGVSGIAHWSGPALYRDATRGLVDFVEVLQISFASYDGWYRMLNLGVRIAPTAGTDFPCGAANPPGSERFYTRVEGPFDYRTWLEAVRQGRTFVTNGPLLEMKVDGVGPGGRLRVEPGGVVKVEATVRFDPTRDDVQVVEIVTNGEVVGRAERQGGEREIRLVAELPLEESSWIAARAKGTKLDLPAMGGAPRASEAHTGAVYAEVAGDEPLHFSPVVAEETAALLRNKSDHIGKMLGYPVPPRLVGVDAPTLARDQAAVRLEFAEAIELLERRAKPPGVSPGPTVAAEP